MKKLIIAIIILSIGSLPLLADVFGKSGTVSLQFLKLGIDARAIGMGEAYTAVTDDISSVYWNPAGLSLKDESQLFMSHTNWVGETYHEYLAYSTVVGLGYVALSASVFHTPLMDETTEKEFGPTGRTFRFSAAAVGLTYANRFTDQFSFGITGKYLNENIADESVHSFAVDFGTLYNTNWRNTIIGMSLRNFGPDTEYNVDQKDTPQDSGDILNHVDKTGTAVPIPMNFSLGLATDIFREDNSSLIASVQLDNTVDRSETWNVGAEFNWNILFLRGGYQINYDAASYSFGFGVRVPSSIAIINVDYSFTEMGRLQEDFLTAAHRLSLKLAF